MIEPSYDDFRQNFAVTGPNRLRSILPALVLLVAITGGGAAFWQFYRGGFSAPAMSASAEFSPLMRELDTSQPQQQASADQVQALQQDLAAQQAQTRRLADEVEALSSKVNALQQSFASVPTTVGTVGRAPPVPRRKPPTPLLAPTAPLSIRP